MENYSRRYVLRASLLTFGGLCLGLPEIIAASKEPRNTDNGRLNWDQFVEKLEQVAGSQHYESWDQEFYVSSVATSLGRLRSEDATLNRALELHRNGAWVRPDFAELLKTADVQISLITFDKGEWLPHHDHPSMTGVLTCATGELFVDSYDRIYGPASPMLIKKIGAETVVPGKISTLTNTRRNIHSVKALSFTQVIDIFTPPYNSQRIAKTNWYRIEQRGIRGRDDVFAAYPY